MSIRQRLGLGLGIIIMIAALQSAYAVFGIQQSARSVGEVFEGPLMAVHSAHRAQANLQKSKRYLAEVMAMTQPVDRQQGLAAFDALYRDFANELTEVKARTMSPAASEALIVVTELAETWRTAARTLLGATHATEIMAPHAMARLEANLASAIRKLNESTIADAAMMRNDMHGQAQWQFGTAFFMLALGIVTSALVGYSIVRALGRPLAGLETAMTALAENDLEVQIPYGDRQDEIGRMARAVAVFKTNAQERQALEERQAQAAIDAEVEKRRTVEKMLQDFEQSVASVVDSLTQESAQMKHEAQGMVDATGITSQQFTSVTNAANGSTARVQSIATSAVELAQSIREINAQVSACAASAERAAEEGQQTSSQMSGLEDAAKTINEVIELISNIAEQTNLLALNATIEAARAGEAGRGFAVVAQEVKNLASQTANATVKISAQVQGMQQQTTSAVSAISNIVGVIVEIRDLSSRVTTAVSQQDEATQDIASNAQEASQAMDVISNNVGSVSQKALETGESAHEVLSASSRLAEQSEMLKRELSSFVERVRAA